MRMKYEYPVRVIEHCPDALSSEGSFRVRMIRMNIFDMDELIRVQNAKSSEGSTFTLRMNNGERFSIVPDDYMRLYHMIGLRNTMLKGFETSLLTIPDYENE